MADARIRQRPAGVVHVTVDVARYPAAIDALRPVIGSDLASPGMIEPGAITVIWQGPMDWLLMCPREDAEELARHCRAALAPFVSLANDVSAGSVVVDIDGTEGAAILAGGTGIDLDTIVFPPGASAVTRLAGIRATIIHRFREAGQYRVIADRSRAAHLCRWLTAAILPEQD